MLKFVKRINEDHQRSKSLNPPILVHCSAGVGRSGTLVAIDGLVQQLREDGNVTIYSHVCDLRHQRNYLVQSVVSFKNYVKFFFFCVTKSTILKTAQIVFSTLWKYWKCAWDSLCRRWCRRRDEILKRFKGAKIYIMAHNIKAIKGIMLRIMIKVF